MIQSSIDYYQQTHHYSQTRDTPYMRSTSTTNNSSKAVCIDYYNLKSKIFWEIDIFCHLFIYSYR
jgi:hypothetical protein